MRFFIFALAVSSLAAAQPKVAFDVVAIKPVPQPTIETMRTNLRSLGMHVEGNRVQIGAFTLAALLSNAFRVPIQQVVAPDFVGTQYFDIQATIPQGATSDQVPEMLQAMLAERFKLTYHRETREYPFAFLTVGKDGMKLPRLPDDTPVGGKSTPLPGGGVRTTQVGEVATVLFSLTSSGIQAVDETGLIGIYSWVREVQPLRDGMTYQDVLLEGIHSMLADAGLKLETRKVPKETIIVDHLEKAPTEN